MSRSDRFTTIGSPLYGKEVPLDWKRMTPQAKRRALVACGLAENFDAACSLMGRHAAAVVRRRRERMEKAASCRHPEGRD